MIRKVQLKKKRIPIKKLLDLFYDDPFLTISGTYWEQYSNWRHSNELANICANLLGINPYKINNCMLHVISDHIPIHRDNMSTGVYVLPLQFTKTVEFYDEDRTVQFEKGFAYKFNDWKFHGISNPNSSKIILVTIDT